MSDKKRPTERSAKIVGVSSLTPHSRALAESGKKIFIDSVGIGRDFCKSMLSTSIGAIPIYLGLLKLFIPDTHVFTEKQVVIVLIPATLFLIASVVFTVGYLPRTGSFSLDILDEIERERASTIRRRSRLIWIGFVIFLIGVLASSISILGFLFS